MVYEERPQNFIPDIEVCGCLIESNNKILLLHRWDNKSQGGKWGLPAGKVNKGEDIIEALKRELFEETGLKIEKEQFNKHKTFYVCYPDKNFLYHYFSLSLKEIPNIKISTDEHQSFKWVTKEEAFEMPLVLDEDYCLRDYYGIK